MNNFSILAIKGCRKIYLKIFRRKTAVDIQRDESAESVSSLIINALSGDQPSMIGRIGATELSCIVNYIGISDKKNNILKYITGKTPPWWWESIIINQMVMWSGFFPASENKIEDFCRLMLNDIALVDVLGSWLEQEKYVNYLLHNSKKVHFELLNPYFAEIPWTKSLTGKKVLVIHPFSKTIESQYKKRTLLFKNDLLPEFELKTIKAVQSIAGSKTEFDDWFAALNFMKEQIDEIDFDICLIGCGAYGFPLAAHVKRIGKKGFHLGGSLQLLFGIRGKRWENENYNAKYNFASLMNEHWVKPGEEEKPVQADKVEGACYW